MDSDRPHNQEIPAPGEEDGPISESSVAGVAHGFGLGAATPTTWSKNLPEILIGIVIVTAGAALLVLSRSPSDEVRAREAPAATAPRAQANQAEPTRRAQAQDERSPRAQPKPVTQPPWIETSKGALAACSPITVRNTTWSIPRRARSAKQGYDMLLLGDLVAAREAFCVATHYESPDELTLTGLLRTQLLLGDPKSALDTAERLIERAPKSSRAHDWRGDVLIRLGRVDEAKQAWTRAVGASRLSAWLAGRIRKTSLDEAREALEAAAYPRADRMLRRALALEPRDIETVVELGRVLRKSERFEAAARWLSYAEHLDPMHPGARREREKLTGSPRTHR